MQRTKNTNALNEVQQDLNELSKTIDIVEKNPIKFHLSSDEIAIRRAYVSRTTEKIRRLGIREDKVSVLDDPLQIEDSFGQGHMEMKWKKQDEHLDTVINTISVLKEQSYTIGKELDDHVVLLNQMETQVDHTDSKLKRTMKRLEKVYEESVDKRSNCIIFTLIFVLVILLVVLVTT